MNTKKNLIIAPHADDEVLGCFTFLKPQTHVLYVGIESRPNMPRSLRIEEIEKSAEKSGFTWNALDYTVNSYSVSPLIAVFEGIINELKPETVLIPQPSYNQDHRAVYDAATTALRPHDLNWFVPEVYIFEQPDSILWHHGGEKEPTLFNDMDIEDKIHSYSLYASQVRSHRSFALVRAMAAVRGAQCGLDFAEGFTVKRIRNSKVT